MYLKFIGALLVFTSSCLFGRLQANRFAKRYSQILDFQGIVQYFETEICYTSTPIMEIFHSLIPIANPPFDKILKNVLSRIADYGYEPLSVIWQDELDQNKGSLYLQQEDLDILLYFGNVLGTTDTENQKKYFTLVKDRLHTQLTLALEDKLKYIKLYSQLGIIVGLFITIIII